MQLDLTAAAAGYRHISLEVIGSTNAEALARARSGDRGPLWVTARRQTAGRGRRGRPWVSEPGNLYASLLLVDPAPPDCVAQLSFVAALAVCDAVHAVAGDIEGGLSLKWPNDVLCGGAKLAGILIEGEGGAHNAVAVGIGVNCVSHPADTAYPATDFAAAGAAVSPEPLFAALSAAMLVRLGLWDGGRGFAAIRADWLRRAGHVGRELDIRSAEGAHRGIFETLDESGRLVLRLADGSRKPIISGDVLPAGRTAAVDA